MSGTTSQPAMGAILHAVRNSGLDSGLDPMRVVQLNSYW